MTTLEYPVHDFYERYNATYSSSLASATASVRSDVPSRNLGSYESTSSSSSDLSQRYPIPDTASTRWTQGFSKPAASAVVPDALRPLRENPRRTSNTATTRTGCPPPLVRQTERKVNFVDNLVDSSIQIVVAIWPNSSPLCPEAARDSSVPLRMFIQETLRRSRTSYSTLQVALYYLVLIKDKLPARDFTMEQIDDCHASRALQCGRRMFLAALILASKYLQDRNYSARAWSKISGLKTNEINQNEMAFLLAVNWKLHITEEVYRVWTDNVMKHSPQPPTPPTSGSFAAKREYEFQLDLFSKQCVFFQKIIRRLNPDLENLEYAVARSRYSRVPSLSPRSLSPRSVLAAAHDESGEYSFGSSDFGSRDATPTPRDIRIPPVMEPHLAPTQSATRIAPAFGLLPTPRLTPQVNPVHDLTPVPSTYRGGSFYKNRGCAMSMAVSTAGPVYQDMILEKWPGSMISSPVNIATRRPSLAASVSTSSSPESMISDMSGTSRSSSVSSISSLASAPYVKMDYPTLEAQARCRSAKQLMMSERHAMRSASYPMAETYADAITISGMPSPAASMNMEFPEWMTSSPETDDATKEADQAWKAAQALQALHNNWSAPSAVRKATTSAPTAGSKRSRPQSIDVGLQDNVRDLLRRNYTTILDSPPQIPASYADGRKRVCCSPEATQYQYPTLEYQGPGMWEGILN